MSHRAAGPFGSRIDGSRIDGSRIDGSRIDGSRIDGSRIDGSRIDGSRIDGSRIDGSRIDGSRIDGSRVDGSGRGSPGIGTGTRGDGPEIPRPHLAVALAGALRTTALAHRAVSAAADTVRGDVMLCDQLCLLSPAWRVALRRAESEAMDKLGVGIGPGGAHRIDAETAETTETCSVIVVHGDGWSLVGRTPAVLVFLLDAAPGVTIDRSAAEGAGELVRGLAAQFT